MKRKLIIAIYFVFNICFLFSQNNLKKDSIIINWDFDGNDFSLDKKLNILDNGYKIVSYTHGLLPRFRSEGSSLTNFERVSVVHTFTKDDNNAIQYTLGPQKEGDLKARSEHYLFVADFGKTYISEFSLKLHPNFTPILLKRADGGAAWCCLRQWHQSSPESPPMALNLKEGSNNVIVTEFQYGTHKHGKIKRFTSTEKVLIPDKWYHFRYEWRIVPGSINSYCKVWVSENKLSKIPDPSELWCNYLGQIGYTLEGKPESEMEPLSQKIREQQGLYQNSDFDPKAFHAVIYDNVKIYLKQ
jgi:hypothetical protein